MSESGRERIPPEMCLTKFFSVAILVPLRLMAHWGALGAKINMNIRGIWTTFSPIHRSCVKGRRNDEAMKSCQLSK